MITLTELPAELPWIGLLAVEGAVSTDDREIKPGALSWADARPALPVRPYESGDIIGWVESVHRTGGLVHGTGTVLRDAVADWCSWGLAGGWAYVPGGFDLGDATYTPPQTEGDPMVITYGRVSAMTIYPPDVSGPAWPGTGLLVKMAP